MARINIIYYSKASRYKTYKIKPSILEKVKRYIQPVEINSYHRDWLGLPSWHISDINSILEGLIKQFGDLPVEHIVLACILFEMDIYYYRVQADKSLRTVPSEMCLSGAHEFFELLSDSSKEQTIGRITFEVMKRRKTVFSNNDESANEKATMANKMLKGKVQTHIIVKGTEVIQLIMDSVSKRKIAFSHLAERESQDENTTKLPLYKSPRNHLKKVYAKILYQYLKDRLPNYSDNFIFREGGALLDNMHLFHKREMRAADTPKRIKQFRVSNFKSALKGKIS